MAPGIEPPLTNDAIAKQIAEVARSSGVDSFRVRISRKDNAQQLMPKVIATFLGATAEHLSSPETWLGQLAGGGHFFLAATHINNASQPFAALQVVMSGEPRPVDALADTRPTWRGPAELVFPARPASNDNDNADPTTYVGGLGATGSSPRNGALQGSAPNPPAPSGDPLALERMRLQQMQDDMARRERAAAEERHRQEMDLIKRQNELENAKLRAEMVAAQAAKPAGEDPMVKMLAIMREEAKQQREIEEGRRRDEQAREERRLEAERLREERRLEREREDRKEREAAQLRLEEKLALERKSADERLMQMLQDKRNATTEMMEMMTPLTNAMGQTMNLVVQSIHAMQELTPQVEGDPPMFKLVGKIVEGIQAAAAAAQVKPVVVRPPAGAVPRPPLPRPSAPRAPAPRPPPPPAAAPPVTPGFAGVQSAPRAPALEVLISMIKSKEDPNKVARFFYANVNDPSIATELAKNQMNIVPTFAPHLLDWLQGNEANQAYTRDVFAAVQALGVEMGAVDVPAEAAEEEVEEVIEGEGGEEEAEDDEPEGQDGDGEGDDTLE